MKRRYSTMVTDAPTPDEAEYWKPMERMRAVMAAGDQHRGPNARPGRAGPRGLSITARLLLSYLATYAVDDGSLRHDDGHPLALDELVEDRRDPARARVDLELLMIAGLVVEAEGIYRVPIMDVAGWE
jgi:hypothetical protein